MKLKVFSETRTTRMDGGRDYNGKIAVAGYADGLGKVVGLSDVIVKIGTSNTVTVQNVTEIDGLLAWIKSTVDATVSSTNNGPRIAQKDLSISDTTYVVVNGSSEVGRTFGTDIVQTAVMGQVKDSELTNGFDLKIDADISNVLGGSPFLRATPFSNFLTASATTTAIHEVRAQNYSNQRDKVTGGNKSDVVSLGGGADVFDGKGGNDAASGGNGGDKLFGGSGRDNLRGDGGNDKVDGRSGDDILFGGTGKDRLYGGADDDVLDGGDQADLLIGGAGADQLDGKSGNDVLRGKSGNDLLNGGDDDDALFGDQGADTLNGGDGADDLAGGAGDDTLSGGSGADTLAGGAGNDTLKGGRDADVFEFRRSDGEDEIEDFNPLFDRIAVHADLLDAFETAVVSFGDTVVTFEAGHTLTIRDFVDVDGLAALVDTL